MAALVVYEISGRRLAFPSDLLLRSTERADEERIDELRAHISFAQLGEMKLALESNIRE